MRSRAGFWLQLTALLGVLGALLAVVSGSLGLGHEYVSALAVPPLAAVLVAAWTAHRHLLAPARARARLLRRSRGGHRGRVPRSALGARALAAAAVSAAQCFRGAPVQAGPWRDYVTLTKPRIMSLLLVTGAAGVFVGAGGVPDWGIFIAAIVGLALACGGASALNHLLDADIDRLMGKRTEKRPVAAGRVPPARALEFGLALSAFSFVLLASTVNVLTAVLALVGNLFYVLVYTRWLKRSTPQNIVIGGAAGAVPPLVGYAAASGNLGLPALWLFLIVFLWTPPHFWALALLIKENYAKAGVPMLPVVRGDARDDPPDRLVLARARRVHARGRALARTDLHRRRRRARRHLPRPRLAAPARRRPAGTRARCSTTRSSTSPCSSWRRQRTR